VTYLQPLLSVVLFVLVIGAWRTRNPRTGRRSRFLVLGILGLLFLSWHPAAWLASQPLECWFPRQALPAGDGADAQAIVVLSAEVKPPLRERPIPLPDQATYERCQYAAWLHKNWRALPVLACGGVGAKGGEAYSVAMRRLLQGEGVPAPMIWTEEKSRSTHENAVYGAEFLGGRGIRKVVLVTEAYHMLRAERCFRKTGIEVIAAPCGFHKLNPSLGNFLPGWKAIEINELILHESVGLVFYWMRGWI